MDLAALGARIKETRERVLKQTQGQLAGELGSVQTLWSRLEKGIGGNIHLLLEFITYMQKNGYPAHMLFAKDFDVELMKKNVSDEKNKSKDPVGSELSELKYFMKKGFEKTIALENLLSGKIVEKKKTTKNNSLIKQIKK